MGPHYDTRFRKSKADEGEKNFVLIQTITSEFNELKEDLIAEIKSLIQLEVEKVVKAFSGSHVHKRKKKKTLWRSKQKEESDVTVLKLQETITTLDLEKDDLEQYGRRVCVRIDDVPVE